MDRLKGTRLKLKYCERFSKEPSKEYCNEITMENLKEILFGNKTKLFIMLNTSEGATVFFVDNITNLEREIFYYRGFEHELTKVTYKNDTFYVKESIEEIENINLMSM